MLNSCKSEIRVRYAETDAMGIVHHANYLIYFEEGRTAYSRQFGASYAELEQMGYALAVVEAQVKYLRPAHYDEHLTLRTSLVQLGSRGMRFSYTLERGTEVLCTGETRHICTDRRGQASRLPAAWLEAFNVKAGEHHG